MPPPGLPPPHIPPDRRVILLDILFSKSLQIIGGVQFDLACALSFDEKGLVVLSGQSFIVSVSHSDRRFLLFDRVPFVWFMGGL